MREIWLLLLEELSPRSGRTRSKSVSFRLTEIARSLMVTEFISILELSKVRRPRISFDKSLFGLMAIT